MGSEKVALRLMRVGLGVSLSTKGVQVLRKELSNWAKLNHPNILELYGVSTDGPYGLALVLPFLEYGDVMAYLNTCPAAPRSPLVLDVARGLAYLHTQEPPIVHGDLWPANVLIRPSGQACLADIGLRRAQINISEEGWSEPMVTLPYGRWMAPEVLNPHGYHTTPLASVTTSADVYAFGMVAYTIYTDEVPFYDNCSYFDIAARVVAGERPPRPGQDVTKRGFNEALWDIVQQCWSPDGEAVTDYLHWLSIVHSDVRGANLLISASGGACLADFGFSRLVQDLEPSELSQMSLTYMNPRWMSPERIEPERHGLSRVTAMTPAADVYSCGMVIYELFALQDLFSHVLGHLFAISRIASEGACPPRPNSEESQVVGMSDDLWSVVEDCWKQDRGPRPTATEVVARVQALITK
ncbi:kinase-like protein [Calocera cornea HHB12733]|uniref:Kinase-like protein n=1 Tax=Calocera cornea HHB12733 TaxID=1353952 RepID=A0A165EI57_9BASI|nr:kinase-like protein [Calocera cornea HHB12733]